MLDTDTKRRIDSARDILVGKVPDPKSQVEQITIALIYKFMDDIDAQAEEDGGIRKFFAGDFQRFGWAKLMRSGLGGHEMLNRYAEAITKMPENPGIPLLFREIFNNAYLPYRDPETLRAFLKIIDEFEYDHSERLGDAFEYLLLVLGSQGDAGQFRTPRHIIDFIVSIIDPKKDETVLDPACGTAGFLISAYKHILKTNVDEKGNSTLTPEERGRFAQNFVGYDISPDMVRLSRANLYLHGFSDPHIHEYDTLTSEERWNEHFDVILANPPFMSPKGGIKPHRRFSIQAKRSEVLFVDYMAEHLKPTGRAGFIVPEGIMFQSQAAYRDLRKMLIENSLIAVISLPAGVFNPYSGVKTSVLILDKALAKQSDAIGFFKVENDGFSLGAQRRAVDKNDLPGVSTEINAYLQVLRDRQSVSELESNFGLFVLKEQIAANDDYNLSGERYRVGVEREARYPIVPLGAVAEIVAGQSPSGESYNSDGKGVPFYQGKTEFGEMFIGVPTTWTTDPQRFAEAGDLLMSVRAPVGPINFATQRICIGRGLAAIKPLAGGLHPLFAFYFLRSQESQIKGNLGTTFASINRRDIEKLEIPLPPLDVQEEIVAEIERYQKVIDGAQIVLENYAPYIPVTSDWPIIELGEICSFKNGLNFSRGNSGFPVKIIGVGDFKNNLFAPIDKLAEINLDNPLTDDWLVRHGDILFVRSNGNPDLVGRSLLVPPTNEPITFSGFTIRGRFMDGLAIPLFFAYYFKSRDFAEMIKTVGQGANIRNLSQVILNKMKVPLPPLETQRSIVADIEAERTLIASNQELVNRFEKKIQETLGRIWGKNSPALAEA